MISINIMKLAPAEHASDIYNLFQAAYRVEADLIGVVSFPPLERTENSFQDASSSFYGAFKDDELVAVIETEVTNTHSSIHSLAVNPNSARQGLGRKMVEYILQDSQATTVTTAEKNVPAINLYQSLGFALTHTFATPEGIQMVSLEKT